MANEEKLPGIKLFDCSGKLAIITGGSKGLGLAMAEALASAGANIMIVNRNAEEGQQAASKLETLYQVKVVSFSGNVTSESDMQAMAQQAMEAFGRIDILINSAGINIRGAIDELTSADFNKVMDVNVNGTWLASRQ